MKTHYLFLCVILLLSNCTLTEKKQVAKVSPPRVEKKPFEVVAKNGATRTDDYYWLRERENPAVIEYLNEENKYADALMEHTIPLQDKLFNEIKGRIKEKDESAPVRKGDYYYYTRYVEGGEYPLFCRKKGSLTATEEVIADGNEMAKGHSFFNLRTVPSENDKLVALVTDTTGRNLFSLQVKDLTTGEIYSDELNGIEPGITWYNDNKTVLYGKRNPVTLIPDKVFKHTLGTPTANDELLYHEKDSTLGCHLEKSSSGKYMFIIASRTDARKQLFFSADDIKSTPRLIVALQDNVYYYADEHDDSFYIHTNRDAVNYRIVRTPVNSTDVKNWADFIPEDTARLLDDFKIFKNHLVVTESVEGLNKIAVVDWTNKSRKYIEFGENVYLASLGDNNVYDTDLVRYNFQSPKTPNSAFDYDIKTGEKILIKQQEVLGGYNPDDYTTARIMVKSRDGKDIPLSIVYKTSAFRSDGTNPCLIKGYGSYGYSHPLTFDFRGLSLLERGFVIAVAHVRGGSEMGGDWYNDGKMMNKKNTFNDFIDCSEFLIKNKYTNSEKLFAIGGSAGGLLMGAIVNMRPDLYKGVVAQVPFVDIVTTMLDESIPLTTFEWKEWGNPHIKADYDYMLSYSPYDNVVKKDYPNLLAMTSLHDSQVQYWEPAKWIAKLRENKTDDNLLLLRTNMHAGHGGSSGRYQSIKDIAFAYAFILDLSGIQE